MNTVKKPSIASAFADLSTALVADACVRLGVRMVLASLGSRPVRSRDKGGERVLPVRHHGSVDLILEAFESADGGEVLVIDICRRKNQACAGDLTALEGGAAGPDVINRRFITGHDEVRTNWSFNGRWSTRT